MTWLTTSGEDKNIQITMDDSIKKLLELQQKQLHSFQY